LHLITGACKDLWGTPQDVFKARRSNNDHDHDRLYWMSNCLLLMNDVENLRHETSYLRAIVKPESKASTCWTDPKQWPAVRWSERYVFCYLLEGVAKRSLRCAWLITRASGMVIHPSTMAEKELNQPLSQTGNTQYTHMASELAKEK